MTVLTNIRRQCMLRVLAGRNRTIVATDTISRDVGMIESCRKPGNRCMAVIAIIATSDVIYALSGCDVAVMT